MLILIALILFIGLSAFVRYYQKNHCLIQWIFLCIFYYLITSLFIEVVRIDNATENFLEHHEGQLIMLYFLLLLGILSYAKPLFPRCYAVRKGWKRGATMTFELILFITVASLITYLDIDLFSLQRQLGMTL